MKIKSHYIRRPSENVDEGISRPVEVKALNAELQFVRDGKQYICTFEDELDERASSDRLNTFLEPTLSEAMETLVKEAMDCVLHHRATDQPNAALLYIGKNINHTKAIGDLIFKLSKIRPVLATDEQDDPTAVIRDFAADPSKIVLGTVNLLKEGANIKRARVGIWGSNIKSPLTFEQVAGRFNRKEHVSQHGHSTIYIPADKDYIEMAERLEGVNLVTVDKQEDTGTVHSPPLSQAPLAGSFIPIKSESLDIEAVFRGEHAKPELVKVAHKFRLKHPDLSAGIGDVQLGALALAIDPTLLAKVSASRQPETYDQKRAKLQKTVTTLSNKLAYKWNVDWPEVHRRWIEKGNPKQSKSTLEELQSKIDWIVSEFEKPDTLPQFGNPFGNVS